MKTVKKRLIRIQQTNLFAKSCKSPSARFLSSLASNIGGSEVKSSDLAEKLPRLMSRSPTDFLLDEEPERTILPDEGEPVLTRLVSLIFQ
jgi:hypothetical protein